MSLWILGLDASLASKTFPSVVNKTGFTVVTGDINSTESPLIWIMEPRRISPKTGKRNGNMVGLISFSSEQIQYQAMAFRNPEVLSQILSVSPSIPPRPVLLIMRSVWPLILTSDSFYATRTDASFSVNVGCPGMLLSLLEILNIDSDTGQGRIRPLSGHPRL